TSTPCARKRPQQGKRSLDPTDVLKRRPELAVLGVPSKMDEHLRLDVRDDLASLEQVLLVPSHALAVGPSVSRHRVHVMSCSCQRGKRVTPDEAGGARQQYTAHRSKSG